MLNTPMLHAAGLRPPHTPGHTVAAHSRTQVTTEHAKENVMPMLNVRVIEGVFTPEQKQQMIHQLTETMVEIEGESLRPVTWVIVEEVKSGDWGIGGNGLTTADVLALQAQSPATVSG
jgi:4-oxalocrotonate tautomerase